MSNLALDNNPAHATLCSTGHPTRPLTATKGTICSWQQGWDSLARAIPAIHMHMTLND